MEKKLEWFTEAKYGLFIHWGLYAIPGGVWGGKPSPNGTEWIMRKMQIPFCEYRKLAYQFDPKHFDPYFYVRKAKEWGMKYITVTAKHHDGFAMFDSKVSDYTVIHTPYGKDIIRQFADACKEEGVTFCVYYSQMQDWEHPDADGNNWDYDPKKKNFERYFYGKVIPQVRELLTNYGPIGMIWFDTPYDMPIELCRILADEVRQCQPNCLINGRIGYGLGDYQQAADNSIPLLSRSEPWETPMTLNGSWGYSYLDDRFKQPAEVLENMVRIVGKGGNLLLNVGPDKNGEIPVASEQILSAVGRWLKINGESIYATDAAPNFPYIINWGDVTYSEKNKILYLHVKKYPGFPYRIKLTGLITKVKEINLLATGEKLKFIQSYEQARDEQRLYIYLPEVPPDTDDTVIKVSLYGTAQAQ